jgi:hypothetical protein
MKRALILASLLLATSSCFLTYLSTRYLDERQMGVESALFTTQ